MKVGGLGEIVPSINITGCRNAGGTPVRSYTIYGPGYETGKQVVDCLMPTPVSGGSGGPISITLTQANTNANLNTNTLTNQNQINSTIAAQISPVMAQNFQPQASVSASGNPTSISGATSSASNTANAIAAAQANPTANAGNTSGVVPVAQTVPAAQVNPTPIAGNDAPVGVISTAPITNSIPSYTMYGGYTGVANSYNPTDLWNDLNKRATASYERYKNAALAYANSGAGTVGSDSGSCIRFATLNNMATVVSSYNVSSTVENCISAMDVASYSMERDAANANKNTSSAAPVKTPAISTQPVSSSATVSPADNSAIIAAIKRGYNATQFPVSSQPVSVSPVTPVSYSPMDTTNSAINTQPASTAATSSPTIWPWLIGGAFLILLLGKS